MSRLSFAPARTSAVLAIALLAACAAEPAPPAAGAVPCLERVYGVRLATGRVELGARDGALPPGATLRVRATGVDARLVADADGRVEHTLDTADDTLLLSVDALPGCSETRLRLRHREEARRAAVRPALEGLGDLPNDLIVVGPAEAPRLVVVRSGDHALSVVDPERGLAPELGAVRLPERVRGGRSVAASPWFAVALPDGPAGALRLAVTAHQQDVVWWVELSAGVVERALEPPSIDLAAPFALARPVDLDGDGQPEASIERLRPRAPQGVAVIGRGLFAAFSGFVAPRLGPEAPPVFVPGVVVRWSLDDPDAAPRAAVLDDLNPQELGVSPDGRLRVVASGVLDFVDGAPLRRTPSAVVWLDAEDLRLHARLDAGPLAAGTAVEVAGRVFVGDLTRARVGHATAGASSLDGVLELEDEAVDSVLRLTELPGGWIAAPSFNTDRLHLIDARRLAVDPHPFGAPLSLGPGRPIFDGLSLCAVRPGRAGVDFVGPELFCLTQASRIVPVELRQGFGP